MASTKGTDHSSEHANPGSLAGKPSCYVEIESLSIDFISTTKFTCVFITRHCLDVEDQEWVYFGFSGGGLRGGGSPSPREHQWDKQVISGLL